MHGLDVALSDAVHALRWQVLTPVFTFLSYWWVKSVALPGVGGLVDGLRRRLPLGGLMAATAGVVAAGVSTLLKDVFDRPRPPAADALVAVPASGSMPSTHAATAFAVALVIGTFHRRLLWPLLAVAVLIALSRVYLGVHYVFDVVAGAALGAAVAIAFMRVLLPGARALWRSGVVTRARRRVTGVRDRVSTPVRRVQ